MKAGPGSTERPDGQDPPSLLGILPWSPLGVTEGRARGLGRVGTGRFRRQVTYGLCLRVTPKMACIYWLISRSQPSLGSPKMVIGADSGDE